MLSNDLMGFPARFLSASATPAAPGERHSLSTADETPQNRFHVQTLQSNVSAEAAARVEARCQLLVGTFVSSCRSQVQCTYVDRLRLVSKTWNGRLKSSSRLLDRFLGTCTNHEPLSLCVTSHSSIDQLSQRPHRLVMPLSNASTRAIRSPDASTLADGQLTAKNAVVHAPLERAPSMELS